MGGNRGFWNKALRHWRRAVVYGVSHGVFGWGAIAALFVAAVVGIGLPRKFGIEMNQEQLPWWLVPLASVVIAFIVVTLTHVFILRHIGRIA
jgi:hypothetical protein